MLLSGLKIAMRCFHFLTNVMVEMKVIHSLFCNLMTRGENPEARGFLVLVSHFTGNCTAGFQWNFGGGMFEMLMKDRLVKGS